MKIVVHFSLYFIVIIGLTSCNYNMYYPSMQNTPMFTESNQYIATISPRNVQGAISITNNLGICYDHSWNNYIFNLGDEKQPKYSRITYSDEFGINYYKNIKEKQFFNITGGFGFGKSSIVYGYFVGNPTWILEKFQSNFYKYYLQTGYTFIKEKINIEFSGRFTMNDYYNFSCFNEEDTIINTKDLAIYFEPAFTIKMKSKNELINFIIQTRISVFLTPQKLIGKYINEHMLQPYLTFGIQMKIWKGLFKPKEKNYKEKLTEEDIQNIINSK